MICSRSRSSRSSTPTTCRRCPSWWPWCRLGCSRWRFSAGFGQWWVLVPLAIVAWALRTRQRRARDGRRGGPRLHRPRPGQARPPRQPNCSNTRCGRCLQVSPSPYSRSSLPESRSAAGSGLGDFAVASGHRRRDCGTGGSASPPACLVTAFLLAKFTHAALDDDLAWRDVLGVSLLAGIGFTVSLLIGELAFGYGTPAADDVKIGVARRVCCRRCTGFACAVQP